MKNSLKGAEPIFISNGAPAEIRNILKATGKRRVAVAYWGRGAIRELHLDRVIDPHRVQIMCDLFSGSCNPSVMAELIDLGFEAKTIDGLHAKVYCSAKAVIVGSSNASRNGLKYDENLTSGSIEANVLIRDPKIIRDVSAWFDEYWDSKLATLVNPDLIKEAEPLFVRNRMATRQATSGLVDKLRSTPKLIGKIKAKVIFYIAEPPSRFAKKTYDLEAAASYSEADRRANAGDYPFYEDESDSWIVKPKTIFLDFTVSRSGSRPSFGGIWQVRSRNFSIPVQSATMPGHRIILLDRLLDIAGHRISRTDEQIFERAIKSFMDKRGKPWKFPGASSNYNYFEIPFSQFWSEMVSPNF
jgi:PLD-like domain